jgi:hypothetical protein
VAALDIENIFTYHDSTARQVARYEFLRAAAKTYAEVIDQTVPDSAEKTLAIRDVQRSLMMANAAIACNEPGVE